MKKVSFKVNNYDLRKTLFAALAECGYKVCLEKRPVEDELTLANMYEFYWDMFVTVEVPDDAVEDLGKSKERK